MTLRQPEWPRQLPPRFVLGAATLGPVGNRLRAPGTWGSFAGLLYFTVVFYGLGPFGYLVACAIGAYVAVGICGEAESLIGRTDPGEVILDEVVAMPLALFGWESLAGPLPLWVVLISAFAIFRVFDILKPFGISRLQRLPGGWGVVVDDLAAALAACVALHALHAIWRWLP